MHQRIRHSKLESFDGTLLDVQQAGVPNGPPIVLANGLGGNIYAWRDVLDDLGERHRIISWDYRGLFRSGPPASDDAVRVEHHARDLTAVLDHLDVSDALYLGWSFGVQVALEHLRDTPRRSAGFVSVCGTFDFPLRSATAPGQPSPFGRILDLARGRGDLVRSGAELLARQPLVLQAAQRLGLVGKTIDDDTFRSLVNEFGDLDMDAYFVLLHEAAEHDAAEVLSTLDCPILLVAGERDPIVPPSVAERVHSGLPGAELLVIPIATHYVPMEFSEYLCLRIDSFIDARIGNSW